CCVRLGRSVDVVRRAQEGGRLRRIGDRGVRPDAGVGRAKRQQHDRRGREGRDGRAHSRCLDQPGQRGNRRLARDADERRRRLERTAGAHRSARREADALIANHGAALVVITLAAAFVNGALGYGFSSITVPLALLFLSNRALNPGLVVLEVGLNAYVLWTNRAALPRVWRRALPVTIGLAPGVGLGTLV